MSAEPTDADVEAALRLSREYIYDGHEPYAPAVMGFARMLAAYREEVMHAAAERLAKAREHLDPRFPLQVHHPHALDALEAALLVLAGDTVRADLARLKLDARDALATELRRRGELPSLRQRIEKLAEHWESESSAGWPDSDERNLLIEHAIALRALLETP